MDRLLSENLKIGSQGTFPLFPEYKYGKVMRIPESKLWEQDATGRDEEAAGVGEVKDAEGKKKDAEEEKIDKADLSRLAEPMEDGGTRLTIRNI